MTDDAKSTAIGPTGRNVVRNIEELRRARGLSLAALSERLGEIGRPILATVLHRLSQGKRRVDADDLMALAVALGVNPNALLFPRDVDWDDVVELPGTEQRAYDLWRWAQGLAPLPPELAEAGDSEDESRAPFERAADFATHALPQAGEFSADPALREVYNLGGKTSIALRDFANPSNWDRRRSGLIRSYRMVGLVLEELIARGDREATAKTAGNLTFDTAAAQRQLQDAAANTGRPAPERTQAAKPSGEESEE